jgi:hypothetical protein
MPERKAAILNISKALLGVSLTALAAIGSATGNVWLAGLTAIPVAGLSASETIRPLLEKKKEEHLELPMPPWWTESAYSWQTTCSGIEDRLPTIINSVAERLRKEQHAPTAAVVRQIFTDEVTHQISPWEIKPQDRDLVAAYVTPPILEKSAMVLKTAIDPVREDALMDMLAKVVTMLDEAQKTREAVASILSSVAATVVDRESPQTAEAVQSDQSIAAVLQQKMQAEAYDVYICYHEADETEVFKIGEQLKAHGVLPWFDIMDVKPGTPTRLQQEKQIEKIPSAAVFVGQHAVVDWQALQMYSFIEQFVQRGCPVVPVLLGDAPQKPQLPIFLANFGWVDFRRQAPEPLGRLIWGITGKRPSS